MNAINMLSNINKNAYIYEFNTNSVQNYPGIYCDSYDRNNK